MLIHDLLDLRAFSKLPCTINTILRAPRILQSRHHLFDPAFIGTPSPFGTLVSLRLPITIIHDMWAQARGRILSHFSRSLTPTSPDQSLSNNSKTTLKIWFHEFLKCHLHDAKTFCMKILQNLVTPVISGDNSRAQSETRPPMSSGISLHDFTKKKF